jgi:hypothetical protein
MIDAVHARGMYMVDFTVGTMGDLTAWKGYVFLVVVPLRPFHALHVSSFENASTPFMTERDGTLKEYDATWKNPKYSIEKYLDFTVCYNTIYRSM